MPSRLFLCGNLYLPFVCNLWIALLWCVWFQSCPSTSSLTLQNFNFLLKNSPNQCITPTCNNLSPTCSVWERKSETSPHSRPFSTKLVSPQTSSSPETPDFLQIHTTHFLQSFHQRLQVCNSFEAGITLLTWLWNVLRWHRYYLVGDGYVKLTHDLVVLDPVQRFLLSRSVKTTWHCVWALAGGCCILVFKFPLVHVIGNV